MIGLFMTICVGLGYCLGRAHAELVFAKRLEAVISKLEDSE